MTKKNDVNNFIEATKSNTDGLHALSVVEISSGMTIGSYSDGTIDTDIASAYNVEVVKAKLNAIKALGLNEAINDILITLSNQYHLINCDESGKYMIYLAADKNKANLAILRNLVNKGITEIKGSLV